VTAIAFSKLFRIFRAVVFATPCT